MTLLINMVKNTFVSAVGKRGSEDEIAKCQVKIGPSMKSKEARQK